MAEQRRTARAGVKRDRGKVGAQLGRPDKELRMLHRLARLYGIEPTYRDNSARHQLASPEALMSVLRSLGAGVDGLGDVRAALEEFRLDH